MDLLEAQEIQLHKEIQLQILADIILADFFIMFLMDTEYLLLLVIKIAPIITPEIIIIPPEPFLEIQQMQQE